MPDEIEDDIGDIVFFSVSEVEMEVEEVSIPESVSENLLENDLDRLAKAAFTALGAVFLFLFLRYQ